MTKPLKHICMATDIPFWAGSTGAEQRMLALVEYLSHPPYELSVFYLGQVTPEESEQIERLPCEVAFFESERPPESFLKRIRWYADATRHQLEKWLKRTAKSEEESQQPSPLKLSDYRWPWAVEQFRQHVARVRPKAIICQYVTMAYLLDALSIADRKHILCVLDTHDILHDRGMQFHSAGYLHWLEISEKEEVDVWNRFDAVIAIQPQEAERIRAAVTQPQVVVAGHAQRRPLRLSRREHPEQPRQLTVGYIASANYSNWHAINRFLIEVWPDLIDLPGTQVELLIAGKICDWFNLVEGRAASLLKSAVRLQGPVERLEDFYSQVDIAINPVQFGTGLKIKNVEALAFGKPLVSTASGAAGMSPRALSACLVADDYGQMSKQLREICVAPQELERFTEAAEEVAKSEFSPQTIFSELSALLSNLD
jgi:glycosyltransferase involved in cell wall biosynthesis